jgi:hypothetical protein
MYGCLECIPCFLDSIHPALWSVTMLVWVFVELSVWVLGRGQFLRVLCCYALNFWIKRITDMQTNGTKQCLTGDSILYVGNCVRPPVSHLISNSALSIVSVIDCEII